MANKERLIEVRDKILANKDRFHYNSWVGYLDDPGLITDKNIMLHTIDVANKLNIDCNTCGCVAGWTYSCIPKPDNEVPVQVQAEAYLGLSHKEYQFLFLGHAAFGLEKIYLPRASYQDAIHRLNFLIERN